MVFDSLGCRKSEKEGNCWGKFSKRKGNKKGILGVKYVNSIKVFPDIFQNLDSFLVDGSTENQGTCVKFKDENQVS